MRGQRNAYHIVPLYVANERNTTVQSVVLMNFFSSLLIRLTQSPIYTAKARRELVKVHTPTSASNPNHVIPDDPPHGLSGGGGRPPKTALSISFQIWYVSVRAGSKIRPPPSIIWWGVLETVNISSRSQSYRSQDFIQKSPRSFFFIFLKTAFA